MQAFAKDSMNNSLGGAGPIHSNINLAQFHGRGAEGYEDYGGNMPEYVPRRPTEGHFSAHAREALHGDETMGLGTSTFLEGAPASRNAIQRRESEVEAQMQAIGSGGLQRKKSLAQKIRGMNNSRSAPADRTTSPTENVLERTASPSSPMSAGGSRRTETNPFLQDYDAAYDQKGARIAAATELKNGGRARAPSSPRRGLGLERKVTHDGSGSAYENGEEGVGNGNVKQGFLNRVKSLKGGRRVRPGTERKDTAP
jgi:hypothetical protein